MRSYKDFQQDAVLLQGEAAQTLKQTAQRFDQEVETVCKQLHEAFENASKNFERIKDEYNPQFQAVLRGTPLESADIDTVGFDLSHLDKHGIAFAKIKPTNNLDAFLAALLKTVEGGPNGIDDTEDKIIVEPVKFKRDFVRA